MFKKLIFSLSLLSILGFGAAQLTPAYGCLPGFLEDQGCCPSTFQGNNFMFAADYCYQIECFYSIGSPPYLTTYCQ